MFEDAVLYLLEAEMVAVEPLLRAVQVEVVGGAVLPGQFGHQLQVVQLHGVFGYGRIHPFQLAQLLEEELFGLILPLLLFGFLAQFVDVLVGRVSAQLVLDRAHLLLQEVVALLLVDILLHLGLDLVLEFDQLLLADQDFEQAACARQQARGLQQPLAVGVGQVDVRADEVDDAALAVDVLDREGGLLGHVRRDVDDPEGHVLDRIHQRVELDVAAFGHAVFQRGDARFEIGFRGEVLLDLDLLEAVQDHRQVAVGHLEDLEDTRGGADTVQVVRAGLLHFGLLLQYGAHQAAGGFHVADQLHRALAPHGDRRDRAGEQHRAAKGQDRQRVGDFRVFGLLLVLVRDDRNHVVLTFEHVRNAGKILFVILFLTHCFPP